MVLTFKIFREGTGFIRLAKNLGDKAIPMLHKANLKYGRELRDSLKRQFKIQKKFAPRSAMAAKFKTREINKREVGIYLPIRAVWLDMMKPHYVSLKRGRKITKWANKYYGRMRKAGRSRFYKGFLWVTPDPFIDKAEMKVRHRHKILLQEAMNKVTKRGG